jgi:O-antigen chain-terminating methyltransferase
MTNAVLNALIERVKAEAAANAEPSDLADGLSNEDDAHGDGSSNLTDAADFPDGAGIVSLLLVEVDKFVDSAYRLLLQRAADDAGKATYGRQLSRGVSRLVVAAKIRLSAEGRRVGVPLTGFRLPILLAAADIGLRRVGLGPLSTWLSHRLEPWVTRRAVKGSLVAWRRRFEGSVKVSQRHERQLAKLSQQISQLNNIHKPVPPVPPEVIDAYYLAFEDANRGSRESVLAKLAVYDDWLATAVPRRAGLVHDVVDIGCGRGEWLSYVASKGHGAVGVDANPVMVDVCVKRGFDVCCVDALTFLRSLPTASVAAVTGFHVIEHVPFDYLFAVVEESYRVLVEGGVVLFETPNPENVLVGSHTFYHDFTHRNPITPTAISFLLTHHGFDAIDIIRSSPYPAEAKVPGDDPLTERVNGHLCGPQDFAVTGRKIRANGAPV